MSSWSALTRRAAREPSSIRASIRLRRAEITAISPPEKTPFPRRSITTAAAIRMGSFMVYEPLILAAPGGNDALRGGAHLVNGS